VADPVHEGEGGVRRQGKRDRLVGPVTTGVEAVGILTSKVVVTGPEACSDGVSTKPWEVTSPFLSFLNVSTFWVSVPMPRTVTV
jgi:hypothetical protein